MEFMIQVKSGMMIRNNPSAKHLINILDFRVRFYLSHLNFTIQKKTGEEEK